MSETLLAIVLELVSSASTTNSTGQKRTVCERFSSSTMVSAEFSTNNHMGTAAFFITRSSRVRTVVHKRTSSTISAISVSGSNRTLSSVKPPISTVDTKPLLTTRRCCEPTTNIYHTK